MKRAADTNSKNDKVNDIKGKETPATVISEEKCCTGKDKKDTQEKKIQDSHIYCELPIYLL